ncbi:MAG: hypothetical protein WBD78_05415 [Methylocella sp.]
MIGLEWTGLVVQFRQQGSGAKNEPRSVKIIRPRKPRDAILLNCWREMSLMYMDFPWITLSEHGISLLDFEYGLLHVDYTCSPAKEVRLRESGGPVKPHIDLFG